MTERTVKTSHNLEARTAALFVQNAGNFRSKIQVRIGPKVINAKSMMGIIALSIAEGDELTIIADGPDSEEAVDFLARMLA